MILSRRKALAWPLTLSSLKGELAWPQALKVKIFVAASIPG